MPTALEAISAMDQTGDIKALQACLQTIIDMGGRRSDEDGTCLSNSGACVHVSLRLSRLFEGKADTVSGHAQYAAELERSV